MNNEFNSGRIESHSIEASGINDPEMAFDPFDDGHPGAIRLERLIDSAPFRLCENGHSPDVKDDHTA